MKLSLLRIWRVGYTFSYAYYTVLFTERAQRHREFESKFISDCVYTKRNQIAAEFHFQTLLRLEPGFDDFLSGKTFSPLSIIAHNS